jgi:uncharacterized membrane protein YdfJ with MMPL/SSD domain
MLVPAIITVVGDKSWWPSALAREAAAAAPAEAVATEAESRPKEPV